MKTKVTKSSQRRRRHLSFNPNSQFIAEAVEEYLKNGGKITQLENQGNKAGPENWPKFDDNKDVDDFLKDC